MGSGYPSPTPEMARKRRELAPAQQAAFDAFGKVVFAECVLSVLIQVPPDPSHDENVTGVHRRRLRITPSRDRS